MEDFTLRVSPTNLICIMEKNKMFDWLLKTDAQKFAEMRGMVARSPSVIHQVCTPKKTMESFVRPGWLGATRISGYPPNTISGSRAPQSMCLTSKLSSFQGESEFIGVQQRN